MCQFACWEYCFHAQMRVKNSHIFLGWHQPSDPQNKFRTNHTCSPTPRFARTVLNMQQFFHNHWSIQIFYFWDRIWNSDECAWRCLYLGSLGFVWNLLKMSTSSPLMEEFCPDIQKYISFLINFTRIARTNFKKMQVSKTTSNISKLFASLDIHITKF